jgi:CPA1 family monovalent cation:H+ antiporter
LQTALIQYIYLILIILALVMLAYKLKVAYPIILVLGGLLISFFPVFGNVTIGPELVFLIFLPPLLYEAAWQISWKNFWRYRRIITSFAFPIVILTACVVAFASQALIPGFTLALGFLLGGIISPPDAISASTILRQVKAPRTMISVLEGESLLNDASSLIVFRFALGAILTGQFFFREAAVSFVLVVVMGVLIGIGVAFIFYCIHRFLPVTSGIEIVLTLVTPYCMYYAAEHFHFSGVLAVVSGGLFLSNRRMTMLSYRSRVQGVSVWNSLVFVLNGLVFILIGLQLPSITQQLGDTSVATAIWYGLAISGLLIVMRFICGFGALVFTKVAARFITVADANPGWKAPIILGWSGMRGVVSLAMALSIPLMLDNGEVFPFRNLILFITFIVILVTLVLQGLTLPWIIRKLKIEPREGTIPEEEQERIIQKKLNMYMLQYLDDNHRHKIGNNASLRNLQERLRIDMDFFEKQSTEELADNPALRKEFLGIYLELLDHQRSILDKINHRYEFEEDIVRKYMGLVDLEEYKVREKLMGDSNA